MQKAKKQTMASKTTRLGEAGEKAYDSVLWWLGMDRDDREKVE